MKPYHAIAIQDCGEPLQAIPLDQFARVDPHPYQTLGAPYGEQSPYYLRLSVLEALGEAQRYLQSRRLGWRIQIFDAYRPIAVQRFMVEFTFQDLLRARGLRADQLTAAQQTELMAEVNQFWALPSNNPATPPPHSTGAALDVTLVDEQGHSIDMGSPIDEVSERSFPNHFAQCQDARGQSFHRHRKLLNEVMEVAGFRRHPQEWWHFSLGDQLWAWILQEQEDKGPMVARYGRVESE
ncbi:MAG TPA: M15 family metallopeptidase [Leptolyngbyaceae cyanobacterium M65_K2018_010]|nr:M15 family metallopeptidase [Leptolyngbyaceae cyanobacterium M65_K2018_010]